MVQLPLDMTETGPEPRAGYLLVLPDGMFQAVNGLPPVYPKVGDIIHIKIVSSAMPERPEDEEDGGSS